MFVHSVEHVMCRESLALDFVAEALSLPSGNGAVQLATSTLVLSIC